MQTRTIALAFILVTTPAGAESVAFPMLNVLKFCADQATTRPANVRDAFAAQCVEAQKENLPEVFRLWVAASEPARQRCGPIARSYPELAYCLTR